MKKEDIQGFIAAAAKFIDIAIPSITSAAPEANEAEHWVNQEYVRIAGQIEELKAADGDDLDVINGLITEIYQFTEKLNNYRNQSDVAPHILYLSKGQVLKLNAAFAELKVALSKVTKMNEERMALIKRSEDVTALNHNILLTYGLIIVEIKKLQTEIPENHDEAQRRIIALKKVHKSIEKASKQINKQVPELQRLLDIDGDFNPKPIADLLKQMEEGIKQVAEQAVEFADKASELASLEPMHSSSQTIQTIHEKIKTDTITLKAQKTKLDLVIPRRALTPAEKKKKERVQKINTARDIVKELSGIAADAQTIALDIKSILKDAKISLNQKLKNVPSGFFEPDRALQEILNDNRLKLLGEQIRSHLTNARTDPSKDTEELILAMKKYGEITQEIVERCYKLSDDVTYHLISTEDNDDINNLHKEIITYRETTQACLIALNEALSQLSNKPIVPSPPTLTPPITREPVKTTTVTDIPSCFDGILDDGEDGPAEKKHFIMSDVSHILQSDIDEIAEFRNRHGRKGNDAVEDEQHYWSDEPDETLRKQKRYRLELITSRAEFVTWLRNGEGLFLPNDDVDDIASLSRKQHEVAGDKFKRDYSAILTHYATATERGLLSDKEQDKIKENLPLLERELLAYALELARLREIAMLDKDTKGQALCEQRILTIKDDYLPKIKQANENIATGRVDTDKLRYYTRGDVPASIVNNNDDAKTIIDQLFVQAPTLTKTRPSLSSTPSSIVSGDTQHLNPTDARGRVIPFESIKYDEHGKVKEVAHMAMYQHDHTTEIFLPTNEIRSAETELEMVIDIVETHREKEGPNRKIFIDTEGLPESFARKLLAYCAHMDYNFEQRRGSKIKTTSTQFQHDIDSLKKELIKNNFAALGEQNTLAKSPAAIEALEERTIPKPP